MHITSPPRLIASILVLLVGSMLTGPIDVATAQEIPTELETEPKETKPVAVENVVDDQAIQRRLARILDVRKRYDDVRVSVEHGVVQFEGRAKSDDDRIWVEELAERTEGVVVVDNQIEVDSSINLKDNFAVIQESLTSLWRDFLKQMPLIVAAVFVLLITGVVAKVIAKATTRILSRRRRIRTSLKDLFNQLAMIGTWVIGLTVAAVVLFPGITAAKALTVLGLGSVAIGFAFKDIFENFFAGILILWRYPFDLGDFIACDGITGRVEEITVRNTMIRRLDGELAVVPNANLFKSTVDVLNNQSSRRVRVICGIAYDEDVSSARNVIADAVAMCGSVQSNRPVEVFANEFADSSVNFEVAWWTGASPTEIRASRDEVIDAIKQGLDAAGIEIPFPYRTLTFKNPVPIGGLENPRDDHAVKLHDQQRPAQEATTS
ncbi:MAG: mechanosensitive ion channel [Pirellulaceae bacterium]|nr:mechanosensitive ion channel [Pirellulaceae bacterium]